MNIAIIGKGTSSIITSLVLLKGGHNITIFYDPETPHINVGESTTPHIQQLIYETLGINIHDMVDREIFSYKMGINFVNWGKGNPFHHNFANGSVAHHFETKIFNHFIHQYLEQNKLISYISEKVNHIDAAENRVIINEKTFDFVVNCAGWESDDNYITPFFSTVNSAQLFVDDLEYDNTHTLHLATEDGWQFGLPFPHKNIFKCGYLYNNNLISHEEVTSKLNKHVYETFSWKPRYAKQIFKHPRIALNGNRLFFLEPLQALSLYYTYNFALLISEYLDNICSEQFDTINFRYNIEMWSYQLGLAYHYQYGSIHSTEFWKKIQSKAKTVMESSFNGNIEVFKLNLERDSRHRNKNFTFSKIGCFDVRDLEQIHFNMIGEKNYLRPYF